MPREPLRFLCDEMLHRLARWLRAAGYDTTVAAGGASDREVLSQARAERRWLLTRDRGLVERRDAAGWVIWIDGETTTQQAGALSSRIGLDWLHAPFSRCLVCNRGLRPATRMEQDAAPALPPAGHAAILTCDGCRRLYWPGGHESRMRAMLGRLAAVRTPPDAAR